MTTAQAEGSRGAANPQHPHAVTARALAGLRRRGITANCAGRTTIQPLRAWPPAPTTEAL